MPNGNYSFVIDASFNPMSFRDRLAPFLIAKEAYDKAEQEYIDRQDKIDKYSFLNDYDDSSTAKQLYQGYVNEYNKSFNDFSKNGLSQGNRRSWLNVRRRYQKNIGRLEDANAELQKIRDFRLEQRAKDPTMLYANSMPTIDDMLDGGKKFNDYAISGDYLYKKGAEIGASASSRIYSDPQVKKLTDAFLNFTQTNGITQDTLDAFRADLSSQPAFQKAIMDELAANGVTDNLKGADLRRATQSIVNGFVNGAIYKRVDNPQVNPDYINAYQQAQIDRADRAYRLDLAEKGLKDENGKIVVDENGLPFQMQALKNSGKLPSDSKNGNHSQLSAPIKITWDKDDPENANNFEDQYGKGTKNITSTELGDDEKPTGTLVKYDDLPEFVRNKVDVAIKDGNYVDYDYYYTPYESHYLDDTEATVTIVPRESTNIEAPTIKIPVGYGVKPTKVK